MTSLESQVDPKLLHRMLEWTSDIEEFERHHAVDGLFHAKGFSVPPFDGDSDALFLLALDIAFWFWIDDRSDTHLTDNFNVDWDLLVGLAENEEALKNHSTSQEVKFYSRLSDIMEARAQNKEDFLYWRQSFARVARGMQFEETIHKNGKTPSYFVCMEYGIGFSTIPNIVATSSLVYSISRSARQGDMLLNDLERCFCIQQRMLNDLNSDKKERLEGINGKVTNLVLLLEKIIHKNDARTFIEKEMLSIIELIENMCKRMRQDDPFVKLFRHAMKNSQKWYDSAPSRFQCA